MSSATAGIDIYKTPVVKPPDGLTSNFDRELSDVQLATIVVFAVTFFLATASLIVRYVTSALIVRAWELDVVLITLAWGTALGYFISVCFCMSYGWGSHAWDITIAEISGYYNYLLPTTLTYMWSPTLTKLSILTVLYRISPSNRYRIGVFVISSILLTYTIVFTALLSGPCNPRSAGSGTCLNNLAISQVVLNILTDLAIMILPLPTLHKLQIPFRQKLVVGGILSLGSAVLLASIARAPYVKIMATDIDFSRKQAEAGVWSLVELNFGILCNNMMRLKPFLNKYLPRVLTLLGFSSRKSDKGQSESNGRRGTRLRGKPSNSYPLHSLEHEEARNRLSRPATINEYGIEELDKDGSHLNRSTDSILT